MSELKRDFWQYFSCSSIKQYFHFINNDWKKEAITYIMF